MLNFLKQVILETNLSSLVASCFVVSVFLFFTSTLRCECVSKQWRHNDKVIVFVTALAVIFLYLNLKLIIIILLVLFYYCNVIQEKETR